MAERTTDRMNSPKSSNVEQKMLKKKSKAELEQEAYMAQQYATVIGELKAAEARNRIRATRLRFGKTHREEIDQIIAFQPNALSALRFEAFMTDPSSSSSSQKDKFPSSSSLQSSPRSNVPIHQSRDPLTQIERRRVQNLLLDDQNLLVNRTG